MFIVEHWCHPHFVLPMTARFQEKWWRDEKLKTDYDYYEKYEGWYRYPKKYLLHTILVTTYSIFNSLNLLGLMPSGVWMAPEICNLGMHPDGEEQKLHIVPPYLDLLTFCCLNILFRPQLLSQCFHPVMVNKSLENLDNQCCWKVSLIPYVLLLLLMLMLKTISILIMLRYYITK